MYESMEDVRQAVEDNGGLLVIIMQELKVAYGVKRCSSGNLNKISAEIKKLGLDHLPVDLPNNQGDKVSIIFDHNIPRAKVTARSPEALVQPIKSALTKEERFGDRWNDFGVQPNEMEYAEVQLNNARASRDYSILHGRSHPYSLTAKNSYEKAVERCYACELKVFEVYQDTEFDFPYQFQFEYFNSRQLPQNMIGQAPEGNSVIEGYVIKGFGKSKLGKGVVLPVDIFKRKGK